MSDEKTVDRRGTSFIRNVGMLMGSHLLIKLLGFIYKLVITNVEGFGDTGNGYYAAGYQIYSLLLTLSSTGIPSVISKLVAERLAIGDKAGAQRIFRLSLGFFGVLGFIFSLGLYFGADGIALHLLNVPGTAYVMKVLAPAIVFVSISAVMRGYYAGQQDMRPNSISQILEQFLNCVLTITFVYACVGQDAFIMAAAGNVSTTLSVILAFIYMLMYYRKHKISIEDAPVSPEANQSNRKLLKIILAISIPITIGSIISVIGSVIDTATVSNCVQIAFSNMEYTKEALETLAMAKSGILNKIDTLVTFPVAVNSAFCTALVPAISEAIALKDFKTAKKRMLFSLFASIIIILPCAVGFAVLAEPILKMLYPAASDGALIFQLYTIPMILIALNYTLSGGLYGLNLSKVPAIALGIGVIVKTVLNIVLISNPNINIVGAAIGSIVCQLISFSICYIVTKKKLKLEIDKNKMIVKPVIAAVVMGILVGGIHYLFSGIVGNTISTMVAIILGAIAYLVMILGLKVLSKEDMMSIPFGNKLYAFLQKMHVYQEENEG